MGALISEAFQYSSGIFEFWLTLSFAAVVAAAFAAEKFSGNYIKLLTFGYLLASVFLFLVRLYIAFQIVSLMEKLTEAGFDSSRFDTLFGLVVSIYAQILHIAGTIGVVIYMSHINRTNHE